VGTVVSAVFDRLDWASLYGLSFEVLGREWERVTPRSMSIWTTVLEVIEVPRSECTVCGIRPLRSMVSAMNSFARSPVSAASTVQPTMYRL
jgi:hypothetical protein